MRSWAWKAGKSALGAFVDKLVGAPAPSPTDDLLALAKDALESGDTGGAAQAFAGVLQGEPANLSAIGGLARCYLAGGDIERASEVVAMAPSGATNPDLDAARASLALAAAAPTDAAGFEKRLVANPDDHEARFEVAKALAAKGRLAAAADQLLTIIERDRDWREGAARAQLLTVFEAAGAGSEVARQGRRRLSSILFA